MLQGRNITIGITGGIAAYKIPQLVRELRRCGADVRVVMTEAATEFVSPTTLSTLSGHEVVLGMFPLATSNIHRTSTWHVEIGQWADAMLIAPATANTVAKLAHGEADNAITTLALALRCPLVLSPSMDVDMWNHPLTQESVLKLREVGCIILPPEEGPLASGLVGSGRLPEIQRIVQALDRTLDHAQRDMARRKVLITAGPTYEAIDAVRFLGNRSSGKMGFALANAAAQRGADVTLVSGPVALATPRNIARRIDVESAEQMYNAVLKEARMQDIIIMAAAVADFAPVLRSAKKIKKEDLLGGKTTIELRHTKDILHSLGESKNSKVLVGFALETHNEVASAKRKLKEKNLDLVVLNNPMRKGAGFGTDTNIVAIISRSGKIERLKQMPKFDVAHEILDRVVPLLKPIRTQTRPKRSSEHQ